MIRVNRGLLGVYDGEGDMRTGRDVQGRLVFIACACAHASAHFTLPKTLTASKVKIKNLKHGGVS